MMNRRLNQCVRAVAARTQQRAAKQANSRIMKNSDEEPSSSDEFNGSDDEEIDEDQAFNQSDWQKYGEWFPGEQDEDASDDEGPEGSGDDTDGEEGGHDDTHQQADEWLEGSEGDEEDGEDKSEDSEEADGNDLEGSADEDSQHDQLLARIAADGSKRKKRTVVLNEAITENEFSVAAAGHDMHAEGPGGELGLDELLHATQVSQADRKALQKLATGKKVIGAALPEVIRKRQQRKAAYVVSSKEASKWMPLVQANRHAPTLRLTADKDIPQVVTAAGLASKHVPASDYECEIAALLQEAGHHNAQAAAKVDNELGRGKYSADEWQKKQDALARNNALLFYQESKAKRLKKIKSKAYHRHLKKSGTPADSATAALDDPATLLARAEEEEFRRAQERLTLKHRNTSRWARRVLKRGLSLATEGQQDALQDQLRLGQALRAKAASMHDEKDGSDSDSSTDASDEETAGAPEATGALTTKEKVELVEAIQQGHMHDAEDSIPKKGLFAMPFMRRALSKQRQEIAVEAEEILKAQDLVDAIPGGAAPVDTTWDTAQDHSGRFSFNGNNTNTNNKHKAAKSPVDTPESFAGGSTGGELLDDPLRGKLVDDEDGARMRQMRVEASEKVQEASQSSGVTRASVAKAPPSQVLKKHGTPAVGMAGRLAPGNAELDTAAAPQAIAEATPAEASESPHGKVAAAAAAAAAAAHIVHDMRDVISAAFAGDDVVADFEKEKAAVAEESTAGIEEPSALPGWGLWANRKREPQWLKDKKAAAEKEKASRLAKRKDSKLKGVIISEKWDKKAAKLTVTDLPFPYTRSEEYDRGLRVPLGSETNTAAAFRDLTRPSVLKETGQIIAPLRKTSATLQAAAAKKRKRDSVVVVAGGAVKMNKKH